MPKKPAPYIDKSGCLVIPFNSDPKYHYWNGGQSLSATLQELDLGEDKLQKYIEKPFPKNVA